MRATLRSAFIALLVAAVVLIGTFAAEMTAVMLWMRVTASDEGGLGAVSMPDLAIPFAVLAFIATFGWRAIVQARRAVARSRPPAS